MKNQKIKFEDQLIAQLIKGAVIIWHTQSTFIATLLIRLPKGAYADYEYEMYQTFGSDTLYHAVSYNGAKRAIINKANKSHWDTEYHAERMNEKTKIIL